MKEYFGIENVSAEALSVLAALETESNVREAHDIAWEYVMRDGVRLQDADFIVDRAWLMGLVSDVERSEFFGMAGIPEGDTDGDWPPMPSAWEIVKF